MGHGCHSAGGVILEGGDGPVALAASTVHAVEAGALALEEKRADPLRYVLDDLSRGSGGVGEVARAPACDAVAALGSGKGSACEIGAKGVRERGTARELEDSARGLGDGELGPVELGRPAGFSVFDGGEKAPHSGADVLVGGLPSGEELALLPEGSGWVDGLAVGADGSDGSGEGAVGGISCSSLSLDGL